MCERKQAKAKKVCPKESSASRVLDPNLKISKTLQQRNTVPNSVGDEEIKSDEHVTRG